MRATFHGFPRRLCCGRPQHTRPYRGPRPCIVREITSVNRASTEAFSRPTKITGSENILYTTTLLSAWKRIGRQWRWPSLATPPPRMPSRSASHSPVGLPPCTDRKACAFGGRAAVKGSTPRRRERPPVSSFLFEDDDPSPGRGASSPRKLLRMTRVDLLTRNVNSGSTLASASFGAQRPPSDHDGFVRADHHRCAMQPERCFASMPTPSCSRTR